MIKQVERLNTDFRTAEKNIEKLSKEKRQAEKEYMELKKELDKVDTLKKTESRVKIEN